MFKSLSSCTRLLCAFALFSAVAYGQGERATVTGAVTDTSGSIVVNAHVSIHNVATNVVAKALSTAS